MEEETAAVKFLEGVDEENVKQEIWSSLNKLYSHISHLVNYKYSLLLYRLTQENVKMETLTKATGYSRQRIHEIVTLFERREVERIHENG